MKLILMAAFALSIPTTGATQTEAAPDSDIDAAFNAMDANKDGNIDRSEYRRHVQERFARQADAMDAAFTELDKNKDGKVTKAEAAVVPVIASAFNALDTDRNGSLSRAEMQDALAKSQALEASR